MVVLYALRIYIEVSMNSNICQLCESDQLTEIIVFVDLYEVRVPYLTCQCDYCKAEQVTQEQMSVNKRNMVEARRRSSKSLHFFTNVMLQE